MPPLTKLLIGANVVVFVLEAVFGQALLASCALWPIGHFTVAQFEGQVGFKLWQLITCGFLHANLLHLAINMYALWMFGSDVERAIGPRHYLTLYFASLLCSSATQLLVVSVDGANRCLSDRRRVRSDLWHFAGLRHALPDPHDCLDLSANSDAGHSIRGPVRPA